MHRMLRLAVALGSVAAAAVAWLVLTPPAGSTVAPPGDTIVDITGDAANGFEITYYDGTGLYPPTDSEARAECAEHDTRVQRVRCRVEVRTWYRDLAATQQALDWAHHPGSS
ncbi:hypothetical protein [Nocardioides sp. SYSU D00038]|uniref:hypothetical protein n=1 Tax=Nocardioides sp. SYSU D00038 TaxID=2812554 RepID=UPI001967BCC1|nr:hypothetical protein [Nocardioides sp. SYSU D00038]